MNKQQVSDTVMNALQTVKSGEIIVSENLFGLQNNFVPRDMACVLLQLEKQLGVSISQIVHTIDKDDRGYTADALIDAVFEQKCAI